jgi:hypothetical protein
MHTSKRAALPEQMKQVVSEPPAPTTPVCPSENSLLREDDPRIRGAAIDEGGSGMEELVSNLVDLGFMEGQGLRQPEDEAAAEEEEDPQAVGGKWTDERLDQPLHQHTDMTVRDLVWSLMDVCKDTVKGKPLDEIIKIFKRSMPKDNCMPGCAQCPERSIWSCGILTTCMHTLGSVLLHLTALIHDFC